MGEVCLYFGMRHSRGSAALARTCINFFAAQRGLKAGEIARLPSGKPVAKSGEICFSVSHSGDMWLCAVHTGPVGVDIEMVKPRNFSAIAGRLFSVQEQQYAGHDPHRFYEIWCAKEAWVKLEGTGIARGFSGICTARDGNALTRIGDAVRFRPDLGPDYSVCLWARGAKSVRLLPIPEEYT